jgi:hypothetical protein
MEKKWCSSSVEINPIVDSSDGMTIEWIKEELSETVISGEHRLNPLRKIEF